MTTLAARLHRLRGQAGATDAAPERDRNGLGTAPDAASGSSSTRPYADPADLRAFLRRQLGLRGRGGPMPRTVAPDRRVEGEAITAGLHLSETLHDAPAASGCLDAGFAGQPPIACTRFLHFDTETTGLAGGTGTRAFMIGAGDWRGGRLRLRQLTLTTLAAEAEMLRVFAGWIAPDTVLVSYNGKCYDAPLLATRYRLARLSNPLPGCLHLDLLHPVRRRWRAIWPNCRLATAERELLGVLREDDLPGSEAPRAWLDYLRGGSARDLRRVAAHNAQDLRSLAGLLLRLGREGRRSP